MPKNGLHLITPTSISVTGTGASGTINAKGSVTFSSCTTVSFNGIFSADYDNYMIVMRSQGTTGLDLLWRMRSAGTDNSTTSSYTIQYAYGNSTSITGGREISNLPRIASVYDTQRDGAIIYVYGPYIAQPTALRAVAVSGYASGSIFEASGTHNQSTSYDGITLSVANPHTYSGLFSVYGLRK